MKNFIQKIITSKKLIKNNQVRIIIKRFKAINTFREWTVIKRLKRKN